MMKPKYTTEELVEKAKKLMDWDEERRGEPTLLEYLRYYRSGTIGEIHIEAAITAQQAALLDRLIKEAKTYSRTLITDIGKFTDTTKTIWAVPVNTIEAIRKELK